MKGAGAGVNRDAIAALLESVARGQTTVEQATVALRDLPFKDLGYANVDHHRALRVGIPEVVLGAGKTFDQIAGIIEELARGAQNALVTRVEPAIGQRLEARFPALRYDPTSRTAQLVSQPIVPRGNGPIAVVTAGTSDIPVAEEAAVTATLFGNDVHRLFDVGVAGIHRLLARRELLEAASVVIVVAGMEGALASVVGGLTSAPVVAVPTSTGYGSAFEGVTALLAMVSSCASGVTVVGIDNGFGAACAVVRLLNSQSRHG